MKVHPKFKWMRRSRVTLRGRSGQSGAEFSRALIMLLVAYMLQQEPQELGRVLIEGEKQASVACPGSPLFSRAGYAHAGTVVP